MSPKSTVHGGVTDAAQEQAWREGKPYEGPAGDPYHEREDEQPDSGESEDGPMEETAGMPRPARDDPKNAWIIYAVSLGWSREDATAATKQQLIDGTKDAGAGDDGDTPEG